MSGYKNLMQRRRQYRCPGRPPHLRVLHHTPGPSRTFAVRSEPYKPGPPKRAELTKLLHEMEASMTKRQRRRCGIDTSPTDSMCTIFHLGNYSYPVATTRVHYTTTTNMTGFASNW